MSKVKQLFLDNLMTENNDQYEVRALINLLLNIR